MIDLRPRRYRWILVALLVCLIFFMGLRWRPARPTLTPQPESLTPLLRIAQVRTDNPTNPLQLEGVRYLRSIRYSAGSQSGDADGKGEASPGSAIS